MDYIEEQTGCFIKMVQETREYLRYRQLLERVRADRELYERVNKFRKKSFMLGLDERTDRQEASDALYQRYSSLLHNSLAADFLSAEQEYLKLIRRINARIMEGFDLDIDFLED